MWRTLLVSCHLVMVIFLNVSFHKCEESSNCPDDYYTDNSSRCQPCTECSDGSMLVESCTNQSDTVCRSCDLGTYSTGGLKCRNCSQCQPGTFVSRHCTLTSDTQCEPCAKGFYSSDWSARFCMPCSRCSRAMTVEKNCSKTHDYKCGDCIEGYYRHPNLPSTCIKCSYCYPDRPKITVVVDECFTKSKDPTMRCMPLLGGGRWKSTGSLAKKRTSSATTLPTSSPITPTAHMISSMSFLYGESYSVPIPPKVAIPIISVSVVLIIIILATFCILHKRKQLPKKSETITFLHQMCQCKSNGEEIPSCTQKSKQIKFVMNEPESFNDLVGKGQTFNDEAPLVSCSQCLIHYGIGGGSDSNHATTVRLAIGQNHTRDEPPVRETCTVEIDVVERRCPSPVNVFPKSSESNRICDSGNDLPEFIIAPDGSSDEGGTANSGNSVERRISFADNNGCECEETSVSQPSPVLIQAMDEQHQGEGIQGASEPLGVPANKTLMRSTRSPEAGTYDSDDSGLSSVQPDAASVLIQEMDEQHQGEGIQGDFEPLGVPANKTLMRLTRSPNAGTYDSDDSGLSSVQPDAAESVMIFSLNVPVVPSRLTQRKDSGTAEAGTEADSAENASHHGGAALQTGACPDVPTPRYLQQLMCSTGDASTDSEGSFTRSAMSSDYDSDVGVNKTLLDRGHNRSASGERRPGRVKKKTRRHSNHRIRGLNTNSGTLESYSKLDTFTPNV